MFIHVLESFWNACSISLVGGSKQTASVYRILHNFRDLNNRYETKQSCGWYFTEKRILVSFISMVQSLSCGQVWIFNSFSKAQTKTSNLHGGHRAPRIRTCYVSVKSYARYSRQPGLARSQHTYTTPAFPTSVKTFPCWGRGRYASHYDQPNCPPFVPWPEVHVLNAFFQPST